MRYSMRRCSFHTSETHTYLLIMVGACGMRKHTSKYWSRTNETAIIKNQSPYVEDHCMSVVGVAAITVFILTYPYSFGVIVCGGGAVGAICITVLNTAADR